MTATTTNSVRCTVSTYGTYLIIDTEISLNYADAEMHWMYHFCAKLHAYALNYSYSYFCSVDTGIVKW